MAHKSNLRTYLKISIFLLAIGLVSTAQAEPKYVIFLIGDGMGFEQVKAAGMYAHGEAGTLSFESFPYNGQLTTYAADSPVPDSAAAATLSRIQGKSVTKRYFRNSYAHYKMVLFLTERRT